MKTLLKTLSVLFLIAMISGCSSGPNDTIVKDDIKMNLLKHDWSCAFGNMTRKVNEITIVGKTKKDDAIVFQAVANVTDVGPCNDAGNKDFEITISYEKFGKAWRQKEDGFDYRWKKRPANNSKS